MINEFNFIQLINLLAQTMLLLTLIFRWKRQKCGWMNIDNKAEERKWNYCKAINGCLNWEVCIIR